MEAYFKSIPCIEQKARQENEPAEGDQRRAEPPKQGIHCTPVNREDCNLIGIKMIFAGFLFPPGLLGINSTLLITTASIQVSITFLLESAGKMIKEF